MSFFFTRKRKKTEYKTSAVPAKIHVQEKSEGNTSKTTGFFARLDWERMRIQFVVFLFCLIWCGLWARAWYLQIVEGPHLSMRAQRQHMATELVTGRRGMILDRNGQVLASSIEARSVYARPHDIRDPLQVANTLGPILGMEPQKLYNQLSTTKRRFIWLKRKIDDFSASRIQESGLAGIGLTKEYDRVYPFKHMAGQVLGFVGLDDKGLEGIESSMDERLGCPPTRQVVQRDATGRRFYMHREGQSEPQGEDLTLTLDVQLQFIAEEAIARTVRQYDARWGGAIVVDVESGDILAWAQYPFFNPNSYKDYTSLIYRNRLAADALEPGSTFKPFVMAAALQEKKVGANTLIDCEGGRWSNKNFTIRDTSRQGVLPASKVLRYSSNIGMAKIGLSLGVPRFHKYLQDLGFGSRTVVPVSESRGILRAPKDWSTIDIMATSFGQSISVTGLQMTQAYLTLLNGGIYKPLRLVREAPPVDEPHTRVFSEKTTRIVMDMMRDVVEEKDGTGRRARVDGVEVAGKTGTAQKADRKSRTYGSKRLASFVGFLPARNPRFLILVMVDEPTNNQFGGVVAAPVFSEIAGKTMAYAGATRLGSEPAPMQKIPAQAEAANKHHGRGLKLAGLSADYLDEIVLSLGKKATVKMDLAGQLSKAGSRVPDVMGKSVRNAVEMFARAGIVPEVKGNGSRVVRQSPPAGSTWPDEGAGKTDYILWLSER